MGCQACQYAELHEHASSRPAERALVQCQCIPKCMCCTGMHSRQLWTNHSACSARYMTDISAQEVTAFNVWQRRGALHACHFNSV